MDRDKMLDVTLQQIEKQFGKGAVMKLGEHPMGAGITVIPTGSLALDIALGVGGIPRGRIVEVFGPEGSGKTTVCLHMIAEAQRAGRHRGVHRRRARPRPHVRPRARREHRRAARLPAGLGRAGARDRRHARALGGARHRGHRLGRRARAARRDRGRDGRHARGAAGPADVAGHAQARRHALSKFDTSAIFINQLREKIGVMFGSPETTPGGRALKFYSSVRLDVRKIENLKDGTEVVGSRTRVKVVKNKVAPPFRQCEFDIMYGKGISKEGSLIDVGVDLEIVKKSGAWFTYEGEQLGQGRENARQFLAEHVDVRDEIERKVREAVGLTQLRRRGRRDADRDRPRPRPRRRRRRSRDGGRRRRRRPARHGCRSDVRPHALGAEPTHPKSCHERALGLLAVRPRSRRELERRLLQAGFEPEEVADVLERLERVGLIDDEAFARQVAEHALRRPALRRAGGGGRPGGQGRGTGDDVDGHRRARTATRRTGPSRSPGPGRPGCGGARPREGVRAARGAAGHGAGTRPEVARRAARRALERRRVRGLSSDAVQPLASGLAQAVAS